MPAAVQIVRSAEKAAVLLQPGRLDLLQTLEQPNSGAGLARRLGVPRQKLNYHLRELERGGFLELVEERRKGNCTERIMRATARSYVIGPQAMGQLGATPDEARDRFSVAYLVAAAVRVIRELAGLAGRAQRAQKRVATLTLESEIRFATAENRAAFAEELAGTLARLTAKYHDENVEGGRRFRVLAACYPSPGAKPETKAVTKDETESINL